MREKRTVVWERKRTARMPGSPEAERIRARLRPNAFTRVTDFVFERFDALVEATDRIEERLSSAETPRFRRMLYGYFAALASGLILRAADTAITPGASVPGLPAIAIASLVGALALYRGRERQTGDEPRRILLGFVVVAIAFVVTWLIVGSTQSEPILIIRPGE